MPVRLASMPSTRMLDPVSRLVASAPRWMPLPAMPLSWSPAQAFLPFSCGRCRVAAKTVVPVALIRNLAAIALVRFHLCFSVVPASLCGGL